MSVYHNTRRWHNLAAFVKKQAGYRCNSCGKPGKLEAHHIHPVKEGGAMFDIDNVVAVCTKCHLKLHKKGKQSPWWDAVYSLMREVRCGV